MTGLAPSSLTAIERGERYPTLETLEALTACLRISIHVTPRETIIDPVP